MPNPRSLGQILDELMGQEETKPEKVRKWRNIWLCRRTFILMRTNKKIEPGEDFSGRGLYATAEAAREAAQAFLQRSPEHGEHAVYKGPVPVDE